MFLIYTPVKERSDAALYTYSLSLSPLSTRLDSVKDTSKGATVRYLFFLLLPQLLHLGHAFLSFHFHSCDLFLAHVLLGFFPFTVHPPQFTPVRIVTGFLFDAEQLVTRIIQRRVRRHN